ncbi:hypothetical protein [Dehalobacterium formicoaceticum]|uniref:Uncharacterized protein n=1 Tax=Dehalobacterium formicoaceticum TaxID=51515 RepID=A0ABT1Y2S2_9FIRM|nr:hypothetical protein [Dehalobacterium formicoaceticum]MCR6545172.1 hypothetical protein [Dehalobacterium formicoaceticum]
MTNQRFLHIKIHTDSEIKADINIPLGILKATAKFPLLALNVIPQETVKELRKSGIHLQDINMGELTRLVEQGKIKDTLIRMEVLDPIEGRIKVRIYIDGSL